MITLATLWGGDYCGVSLEVGKSVRIGVPNPQATGRFWSTAC